MIDDLRQIAIFAKIVEHGSFRAAAKALKLSPSVVSHHVSQLEERLDVALMYRSTRNFTLTESGQSLLESARQMIEAAETGINDIRDMAAEPSGELRITIPAVLSHSRLVDEFASFSQRYPKVTLNLVFSDSRYDLIRDGFDLGIRMGLTHKRGPTWRLLRTDKRCLIAATDYLLGQSRPTAPKEAEMLDWLELDTPKKIKPTFWQQDGDSVKLSPKPRITVNDANALYQMARAGAGLAIVPEFLVSRDAAAGRVQILLTEWQTNMLYTSAEWPRNAPKNGLIKLLVAKISKVDEE